VPGHGATWDGSALCLPIRVDTGDGPLGVARLVGEQPRRPAGETIASLESIAVAIGIFLDRERTDADLARARDEALEASQMKSRFLANMSHEIRTPMNGVIGMTDLLLAGDLTDDQRRWATTLRTSGRALLGIIDDILDFSKVEAGRLELERVCFDPRDVIDATVAILAGQAEAKGLLLDAFVERLVPREMWGDPGRLQQVLTNILGNAVKFTERGGVTLRVHRPADRPNALRFEIADTGIGIGEERIQALFEPFTQADTSTTRRFGGTGLGLPISRQLVELMGGDIGATSVPGEGTTFAFTIPIGRRDGDAAAAPPVSAAAPSGSG
jgi:signal transduction histidine kinase